MMSNVVNDLEDDLLVKIVVQSMTDKHICSALLNKMPQRNKVSNKSLAILR